MLDAVFDQRLHSHGRNLEIFERAWDVDRVSQTIAKASLLDVQVVGYDAHLVTKRRQPARVQVQRVAQKGRELLHGPLRLARILADQSGDRIQGIEQKVRMYARFE